MNKASATILCRHVIVLVAMLAFCSGCGNGSTKLSSTEAKAFDDAAPAIKKAWDGALAADKINDFSTAQNLLEELKLMALSEPQKQVLEKESTAFGQRLWAAAEKNDPAAVKAIQEAKQSRGRRTTAR